MARFKTRARAVEMLGRQQIANISTAISELFKNAHDAYAQRVEVDYFRSDGLFVLRDDGVGMTREDFESRWLTLGTDSKGEQGNAPYAPPGKPVRPIMGEKGIGRLAIALIGPQVLILTRAERETGLHDLVAAFIHWGLFALPGLDLEQIYIPLQVFEGSRLPNQQDVEALVDEARDHLAKLTSYIDKEKLLEIHNDLDNFTLDPAQLDAFLQTPSLQNRGGTHFYILPANENLANDIDSDKKSKELRFTKFLLGFSNTMLSNNIEPPLRTVFRDWKTEDFCEDLIEEKEFFTPDEFKMADHHIYGRFDEYGQFSGEVKIYDAKPTGHIIPWPNAEGKTTLCGPFNINIAYLQGEQKKSLLPPEDYARLSSKLNKIGGLYIYRDGVRILPYGNSDFDWLEMEKRRSKSASYYFFSHRLIFGAIELSRNENARLKEKAGREGFQEIKAYHQFKQILINFFVQLAADFFRDGGVKAEMFTTRNAELEKLELARREREKEATAKRQKFAETLDDWFVRVNAGEPQQALRQLTVETEQALQVAALNKDPHQAALALIEVESDTTRKLEKLKKAYHLNRPRGVGLTKPLGRDWEAYLQESARLEQEVFAPAVRQITHTLEKTARQAHLHVDPRERLTRLLADTAKAAKQTVKTEAARVEKASAATSEKLTEITRAAMRAVTDALQNARKELASTDLAQLRPAAMESLRLQWEETVHTAAEAQRQRLAGITAQLKAIGSGEIGADEMSAALEDELLALREQVELDADLTQLGMAIEIINHEFNQTVVTIRNNLKQLKGWADKNPNLAPLYRSIHTHFGHLDGYLTLFTPLHRRLYRKAIVIDGADIATFLKDLFRERLARHRIDLSTSRAFRKHEITGYPSTFYPVFVNLIDNAIFWLSRQADPRQIVLNVEKGAFVIADNGPGIRAADREAVFELGFSRKPGGRGLGLYISRDVLRKVNYSLTVAETPGGGTTFRIAPIPEAKDKSHAA